MNIHEQIEICKKRDYKASKHNLLVQKSRYDLSFAEQRAVAYICTMIKPVKPSSANGNIPYQLEYEFDILEYAKVCGMHYTDSGMLYKETRAILKRLMQKIIEVEINSYDDEEAILLAWLTTAHVSKRSGKVKIKINEDMAPFLFGLNKNFTAYGLLNILAMKSRYSIRIYEIMRSHVYQRMATYKLEVLKEMLMVDGIKGYINFNNFRKKVLEPAIAEINEYTDLKVSYEPITKGRKVVKIQFYMSIKPPTERHIAWTIATNKID